MSKVEVRPIDADGKKPKWHGKTGQQSFTRDHVIEPLFDPETQRYATGINEEEMEKVREKLGMPELNDHYNVEQPHPFWSKVKIPLKNQTMFFDTRKPMDFVKVRVMKASKFVANSMKEYQEGRYPEATHVIYDETEATALKAAKVKRKQEAVKLASALSPDQAANIVMILSDIPVKGQSADYITVQVDKLVEEKTDQFIALCKSDPEKTYVRATVLEALHKDVLRKEGLTITFMGDAIASDLESAVEYFLDPNHQDIKAEILTKLTKA